MPRFNAAAPWRDPVPAESPPAPPAAPQITVLPPPAPIPKPSPGLPATLSRPTGEGVKAKPKLDFGGIKKKEAVAPASDYPVLPDPDGKLAEQAAAFLEAQEKEEAAKGAKEAARGQLIMAARPYHFTVNSGHAEVPSSIAVRSPAGEVRVTFKDSYKKLDESKFDLVKDVIGEGLASIYMAQTFEFTIKSESIPEDKMQAVIDAMTEMAARLGIQDAVAVATCYKPTAEWHTARYRRLSPEQNLALEAAIDREKGFCTVAVGAVRGKK